MMATSPPSSSTTTTLNTISTSSPTHKPSTLLKKHLPKPDSKHNVSKSIATVLSGGFAGTIAKTCTAPLTRVQMLSQTGATQLSIASTISTVVNQKGVLNLWRGCLADCIRVFPHKSILFTVNDLLRYQITIIANNSSNSNLINIANSSWMYFITGATAGVIATIGTYPVDLIRCYLAGTIESDASRITVGQICKTIYERNGIFGFYTGLAVTIGGSVPYEGIRIGVYNVLREKIPRVETNYGYEPHPVGKLIVGATAGAAAGMATYPTDTVRRMLQIQQADGMPVYNGLMDCLRQNYRQHGIKRFYRGMTAKLARVAPDAAILFFVYEHLKNYFEGLKVLKSSNDNQKQYD